MFDKKKMWPLSMSTTTKCLIKNVAAFNEHYNKMFDKKMWPLSMSTTTKCLIKNVAAFNEHYNKMFDKKCGHFQ